MIAEKIMRPSVGFQPSQEAKHLAHKADEMDSTRLILVLLLLGLNSELSQIRSLPYGLRMAVMLQCRLIRWVRNVRCQQALMRTVRYACNAAFLGHGRLHECGETVCNGSEVLPDVFGIHSVQRDSLWHNLYVL